MKETHRPMAEDERAAQAAMGRRIDMLERGVRAWRCLAATGFLTALGAFWLAVFGLSQLENTYFIGEMTSAPAPQPVFLDEEGGPRRIPDALLPSVEVLSLSKEASHDVSMEVGIRGEDPQTPGVKAAQETLAAMEGGS